MIKIGKTGLQSMIAGAALLVAAQAPAVLVTVSQPYPTYYGGGGGGEFTISPNFTGATYSTNVTQLGGFQSFCMQVQSPIIVDPPTVYDASLAQVDSLGTPLTIGAAWLYQQYANATLPGYNYVGNRFSAAYNLQQAIWILQGQHGTHITQTVSNSFYVQLAIANFGSLAAAQAPNNAQLPVAMVILTTTNGVPVQNMIGLMAPSAIGDYIWEDSNTNGVQDVGEVGIAGATVELTDCTGTLVTSDFNGNPIAPYVTGADGFYTFTNLVPGQYKIVVTLPDGYVFTSQFQGGDVTKDSNVDQGTGISDCRTLASGQYDDTVDAGAYKPIHPASIGNYIWEDSNTNGVQDVDENGISGAIVELLDCSGSAVTVDFSGNAIVPYVTAADGFYIFTNLPPGQYKVAVILPDGYIFTQQFQGGDDTKDSNVDQSSGISDCRTLTSGQYDDTVDAGAYKPKVCTASICGKIFADCDGNGDLSDGDIGLNTVVVKLLDANNNVAASTSTDTNGLYCFNGLAAGKYVVSVTPPSGYKQTAASTGYHWKDTLGRHCWIENDGYYHCINGGTEYWLDKENCLHWKDSWGRDCWKDRYGYYRWQYCGYKSCNSDSYDNKLCVTLTNCESRLNANFSYTGTKPAISCSVSVPTSVRCGDTITITCTITNTGNVCFKGGTICHTLGDCNWWGWNNCSSYTSVCPQLSPGDWCVVTQKCKINTWYSGSYGCQTKVNCSQPFGYNAYSQSYCSTQVRW